MSMYQGVCPVQQEPGFKLHEAVTGLGRESSAFRLQLYTRQPGYCTIVNLGVAVKLSERKSHYKIKITDYSGLWHHGRGLIGTKSFLSTPALFNVK